MKNDPTQVLFNRTNRITIPRSHRPCPLVKTFSEERSAKTHYYLRSCGIDLDCSQTICLLALKRGKLIFEYYPQHVNSSQSIMLFALSGLVLKVLECQARYDLVRQYGRNSSQLDFERSAIDSKTPISWNSKYWKKERRTTEHILDQEFFRCVESKLHIYQSEKILADYFYQKLWNPLGVEYEASWNIALTDSFFVENKYTLSATSVDLCKLVYVLLNRGRSLSGRVLLSPYYVQVFLSALSPCFSYKNPNLAATSSYGNFVYACAAKDISIIRLGTGYGDMPVSLWLRAMESLCFIWSK